MENHPNGKQKKKPKSKRYKKAKENDAKLFYNTVKIQNIRNNIGVI